MPMQLYTIANQKRNGECLQTAFFGTDRMRKEDVSLSMILAEDSFPHANVTNGMT